MNSIVHVGLTFSLDTDVLDVTGVFRVKMCSGLMVVTTFDMALPERWRMP